MQPRNQFPHKKLQTGHGFNRIYLSVDLTSTESREGGSGRSEKPINEHHQELQIAMVVQLGIQS